MARKFQFVTSGSSFTRPSDWNDSNNIIHVIGAGSAGAAGAGSGGGATGGRGGGAGAYARKSNVTLAGTVSCQIGAANSGSDTWVVNSSTVMAKAAPANSQTGGAASTSVGDVKFDGGSGGNGGGSASGGGGGAAGPDAAGGNGSVSTGGSGNGGSGGGGSGGGTQAATGGSGTTWAATAGGTAGPGGGGGGRTNNGAGGTGGQYGAGGGGGRSSSGAGGAAQGGLIVLEWEIPDPLTTLFWESGGAVDENASNGALVGVVGGRTPNSTLSLHNSAGGLFAIDSETGEVTVASALDYETADNHNVTVRETLTGAPNSPNDTVLNIIVNDTNEGGGGTGPSNLVTPLFGHMHGNGPSTTATNYWPASLVGVGTAGNQWNTVANRGMPVTAGILSDLTVFFPNALAPGTSYACTLMVNGVASALTCTVTNAGRVAFDGTNTVNVNDGDYVQLRVVPSGTPVAQTDGVKIGLKHTAAASDGSGGLLGSWSIGSTADASTTYAPFGRSVNASESLSNSWAAMPCGGSISKLFVRLSVGPGSGVTRKITLVKNDVDTGLSVSISGSSLVGSSSAETVSFVEGDVIYLKLEVSGGTAASASIQTCAEWTPSSPGNIPLFGGVLSPSASVTNYAPLIGRPTANAVEDTASVPVPCNLDVVSFNVSLNSAPGSGRSRTVTVRTAGSDTAASVVISGSNQSGTWLGTVAAAAQELMSIGLVPSGTPTATSTNRFGTVVNATPSAPPILQRPFTYAMIID
jgi:hypothetical protein